MIASSTAGDVWDNQLRQDFPKHVKIPWLSPGRSREARQRPHSYTDGESRFEQGGLSDPKAYAFPTLPHHPKTKR